MAPPDVPAILFKPGTLIISDSQAYRVTELPPKYGLPQKIWQHVDASMMGAPKHKLNLTSTKSTKSSKKKTTKRTSKR